MIFWIVEDDHEQAQDTVEQIRLHYPTAEIHRVTTEHEFRDKFTQIVGADLVILDLILRWTDAKPEMPSRPDDVKSGGSDRAGLRCLELLRAGERTRLIPVILYSVLPKDELTSPWREIAESVPYLDKSDAHDQLLETIRSLLKVPSPGEAPQSV